MGEGGRNFFHGPAAARGVELEMEGGVPYRAPRLDRGVGVPESMETSMAFSADFGLLVG